MAIDTETWWRQEFVPPTLAVLRSRLLTFWDLPSVNIGSKGDTNHRRGYHRSFAWIKNSQYATNRTYSTVETPGNRAPGDKNWLSALDISLDPDRLYPTCRRVDTAVRSGGFEKVTEWYGTFDGKTVVGYNNVTNRPETSDSSHLFHLHLSFDRARVGEDHTDLFEVLTGDDMTPEQAAQLKALYAFAFNGGPSCGTVVEPGNGRPESNSLVNKADMLLELVPEPAPVDLVALVAALKPMVREVVREELDRTKLGSA